MLDVFNTQSEDFAEEKIRFGLENVYIDSWMRRRIYDAFKEILESGVRHHLQVRPIQNLCLSSKAEQSTRGRLTLEFGHLQTAHVVICLI